MFLSSVWERGCEGSNYRLILDLRGNDTRMRLVTNDWDPPYPLIDEKGIKVNSASEYALDLNRALSRTVT